MAKPNKAAVIAFWPVAAPSASPAPPFTITINPPTIKRINSKTAAKIIRLLTIMLIRLPKVGKVWAGGKIVSIGIWHNFIIFSLAQIANLCQIRYAIISNMAAKSLPPKTKIPHHLAIIPDGNRRWAKEHGLATIKGHQKGFKALLEIVKAAREWGIHTVTLWSFSTENWKRSKEEVAYLMKIYEEMIKKYLAEAKKEEVRIIHLGRKDRIPQSLRETLTRVEKETKENRRHILNIALDYGGRDEIVRAIKKWNASTSDEVKNLTEEEFGKYLDTGDQPYPYPDLLIRPSGESRTSGFLLWQTTYTEFYFIKKHLPDCTAADLKKAILNFSQRERRFGR